MAEERGEFDNLPGTGKPLPGSGEHYDEEWWLKGLIERERLTGLAPATLALRKEVEEIDSRLAAMKSQEAVRAYVADLNARIIKANRGLLDGPPVVLQLVDADAVVESWKDRR
jgi:DnaJ homologue, subfamily C, member 28, conserved domain